MKSERYKYVKTSFVKTNLCRNLHITKHECYMYTRTGNSILKNNWQNISTFFLFIITFSYTFVKLEKHKVYVCHLYYVTIIVLLKILHP